MKEVSDNNAQKKTSKKGNNKDDKKPLQVLQLNKKDIHNSKPEKLKSVNISNDTKMISSNENDLMNNEVLLEKKITKPSIINEEFKYPNSIKKNQLEKPPEIDNTIEEFEIERTVDDYDFDENEFLAALNDNEPIGLEGETIKGKIIALESDGLYIDIGGKAPGFMPKKSLGLVL